MPTEELQTIVDLTVAGCGTGTPCIPAVFGPTTSDLNGLHWSSSTDGTDAGWVWAVFFYDGSAVKYVKNRAAYVRAVRGGW